MLDAELETLLTDARSGDDDAFARIWRDLNPSVVRYAMTLSGHRGEDAAAEAWLEVVKRLNAFTGTYSAFKSWVFTIARSKVVDEWRYDNRRPADAMPDLETIHQASAPSAADLALETLATDEALKLIRRLPREQAEVVLLRVVAGLDVEAVSKIVGCSAGNVRVRQHRGLRQLAQILARQESLVTQ